MGFVSDAAKGVGGAVTGVLGALSGQGPSGMDPNKISAGAFKDPALEQNKKLLEELRKRQSEIGEAGYAGQGIAGQQQQQLISQMQARASGAVPSIAEMQLGRSSDIARQALAGQAASMRGAAAGLGMRNVMRQQAASQQDQAGQAALLRAQEQQQAEQSLGAMLGQTRAQDQALMAQGNQLTQQYMGMGMGADQAQFLANQQLETLRQQARMQQAQIGAQQQAGLMGAIGAGLGMYAGMGGGKAPITVNAGGSGMSGMMGNLDLSKVDMSGLQNTIQMNPSLLTNPTSGGWDQLGWSEKYLMPKGK